MDLQEIRIEISAIQEISTDQNIGVYWCALVLNYLWDVWPNLSCGHKCRRRQRGSCLLRLWSPALGVIQLLSGSLQSGPHRVCIVLAQFQNARLKVNCDHCGEKLNHDVSLHCWWRGQNTHQLLQPKDQSSLWSQDVWMYHSQATEKLCLKITIIIYFAYLFYFTVLTENYNFNSCCNGGKMSYLLVILKIIPKIKLKIHFKH